MQNIKTNKSSVPNITYFLQADPSQSWWDIPEPHEQFIVPWVPRIDGILGSPAIAWWPLFLVGHLLQEIPMELFISQ